MWDERYSDEEYAYGRKANDFLQQMVHKIPRGRGRVLCLAEGEGRNAVFLAQQGYIERDVIEGQYHTGKGAVVQLIAMKK